MSPRPGCRRCSSRKSSACSAICAGAGLALLIAEQNIGFLEVATRVFVLEGGRIRFSGTVAEMTDNEALRRAYFGLK